MIYGTFDKVLFNYRELSASGVGPINPFVIAGSNNSSDINLFIHQLSLPDYHKVMFKGASSPSYHISGYGQSLEESLTRALGETVERYSFATLHNLFQDKVVHESFQSLSKRAEVLPLELLNVYGDKDKRFKPVSADEEIDWIPLENYAQKGVLYYPYAAVSGWYNAKRLIIPSVSTGCATHLSYEKALSNALSESFQIHNFMTAWYGKKALAVLDYEEYVSSAFKKIIRKTFRNFKDFKIVVLDNSSTDFHFSSYVSIIFNTKKNFPFCAVGVQGGLDGEYALLRSIMEAAAIYVNLQSVYIYNFNRIDGLHLEDLSESYNLDDPFLFWGNYNDIEAKEKMLSSFISPTEKVRFSACKPLSDREECKALLEAASKRLKYFSVMEITPPEFARYGYKTVKVLTPELVPMMLPALPYINHPAFIKNGGINGNSLPHPLP